MNKMLGAVWMFLTYQLFSGYMVYQHGYEDSSFALFYQHRSSAPLLLLQFGMAIYICILGLYTSTAKAYQEAGKGVPVLFVEEFPKSLTRMVENITLIAVILIPWIGFIWMWLMFHDEEQFVWEKNNESNIVGTYDLVSSPLSFIGNWDNYNYGIPFEGDSFVPFWQPVIIMIPLSLIALLMTVKLIVHLVNYRSRAMSVSKEQKN